MANRSTEGAEPHIALLATCDTKMEEIAFVHAQVTSLNPKGKVVLVDIGRGPTPNDLIAVSQAQVLRSADQNEREDEDLTSCPRGEYSSRMMEAATLYVRNLHDRHPLHGVLGIGGSTGSSIIATVMRDAVPIGLPKMLVSTMASGDIGNLVGGVDMTLMYSVVDIAGLNFLSKRVLGNAAAALSGMANWYAAQTASADNLKSGSAGSESSEGETTKKRIAITMFGVTTPGVDHIRRILGKPPHNAEVVVFHATGSGGKAMEALIRQKSFDAVIDLTTTEIADEVNGGVLSAGPDRLLAGVEAEIPMIVSVGACDMINYGPKETIRAELREACEKGDRKLHVHNPSVTLVRTTKDDNRRTAEFVIEKLTQSKRRDLIKVILPTGGLSMISGVGGPFEDREADEELFLGLETGLKHIGIEVSRSKHEINDREFAESVVSELVELQQSTGS